MSAFVTQLGTLSIQAGLCICMILTVRGIFYFLNLSKRFSYMLWLIPFLLLLFPWQLKSDFSIYQYVNKLTEYIREVNAESVQQRGLLQGSEEYKTESAEKKQLVEEKTGNNIEALQSENSKKAQGESSILNKSDFAVEVREPKQLKEDTFLQSVAKFAENSRVHKIFSRIWILGLLALVCYNGVLWWKLRQKKVCSMKIEQGIFLSDRIETPFVYGMLQPKIYLPSDIGRDELHYVVAHERMHILRKDYFIKLIAFLLVCIHWFNPLIWVAFLCMERDMEMSCDEAVLRKIGVEKKENYARILLNMTMGQHNVSGIPLFFGEGNIRGRIKNIMRKRREFKGLGILVSMVVLLLAAGFLTVPKTEVSEDSKEKTAAQEESQMLEKIQNSIKINTEKVLQEEHSALENLQAEKADALEQESMILNKVVAEVSQREYTLQIVLKRGKIVSDELSPYYGMYEGEFLALTEKDGNRESVVLSFGNDVFYFPKEFELNLADYNGDGLDDFALGQKIGSNYKEYQFFTVMKSGKIKQLLVDTQGAKGERTLIASDMAYSPAFSQVAEVKEYQICYKEYQMDIGEYVEKMAALHF